MGDSTEPSNKLEESAAVELTGRIMVVAIIVLFVVVVFVVFLHLYAKWYWRRVQQDGSNITRRRRRRLDFAAGHRELAAVTALRHGLDPSVLKSIPVIEFSPQDFKDGLECSVCLSEVSEGEKARLLPKCNHGFHVECIDMWFQSHSTCPLCRNPVSSIPESSQQEITHNTPAHDSGLGDSSESLNFPTNVLFWGNETRVSTLGSCLEDGHQSVVTSSSSSSSSAAAASVSTSSNISDGHLVIDIPRQINEEEDQKSPAPTRLRSLKRLLSRDRKINPSSPTNVDVE